MVSEENTRNAFLPGFLSRDLHGNQVSHLEMIICDGISASHTQRLPLEIQQISY